MELTENDIYHLHLGRSPFMDIRRRECIKLFKRKKINASVSLFLKEMKKRNFVSKSFTEILDEVNLILIPIKRDWNINKVLK
jgi:hypothetical protein